jgi:hypothetical protein
MRRRAIVCVLAASAILTAAAARRAYKPGSLTQEPSARNLLVVSTPAIHIFVRGEPVFRKIDGTQFSRLSNTEARIFRDDTSGRLYLELKQFWMSAQSLAGPWSADANLRIAIADVDGRGDKDTVGEVDRELAEIQSIPVPRVVVSLQPSLQIENRRRP